MCAIIIASNIKLKMIICMEPKERVKREKRSKNIFSISIKSLVACMSVEMCNMKHKHTTDVVLRDFFMSDSLETYCKI